MTFGKKLLNAAYPFNRAIININLGNLTVCLPILKLSAVNMQHNDVYVITSLNELNLKDASKRLNIFDYQLIESDSDFNEQFNFFKIYVQEQFSKENQLVNFQIISRIYIYNNQNINAKIITE